MARNFLLKEQEFDQMKEYVEEIKDDFEDYKVKYKLVELI